MKFFLSQKVLSRYPDQIAAFGILTDISVFGPNDASQQILDAVYPQVIDIYKDVDLSNEVNTLVYREMERQIAHDERFGFPSGQIERVLSGYGIHNINNIVNTYMKYELLSGLSFSAYDLASIHEYVEIALSNTNENIQVLGGKNLSIPSNDLVYKDALGVFYSFTRGYAERTKISSGTTSALYAIDGPAGVDKISVTNNIKALCEEFHSKNYFVLNSRNPEVNI